MNKQQAAKSFAALSESARVNIVTCISRNPKITATDLMKKLHIPQSTLSHHLKILVASGLIQAEKNKRWTNYTINTDVADKMAAFLDALK